MDFAQQFEISSPGVIAEDFDGDVVILNLDTGRYFSLCGAAPKVWNALLAGATPQAIVDGARAKRPDFVEATSQFFCTLAEMQLIRPAGQPVVATSNATVDWRTMKNDDTPEVAVFDDLAELILADPIHDIDAEVGWPLRKAA